MASARTSVQFSQLWQFPLLLVSLGLFGYAAYLFIDPQPGLTVDQKIAVARTFLDQERAEATLEQLNRLLNTDKLEPQREAEVHLMLAEALELGQRQKRINIPVNHQRIIEQTQIALSQGARPDAKLYRRLGDSYEALNKSIESLASYRQAMAMDSAHSLSLQRKVIDLLTGQGDDAGAETAIELYVKSEGLTDAERGWAIGEQARMMIDRGSLVDARLMLIEALGLHTDPVAQGALNYRLGYCAWKLGDAPEAERLLMLSRQQLRPQHPLDAEVCCLLGRIAQERDDPRAAIAHYEVVLVGHPNANVAPLCRLGRGICRIMLGDDDPGLADLHDLVSQLDQKGAESVLSRRHRTEVLAGLKSAGLTLAARGNFQAAMELLSYEQVLQPEPPATFFARLGSVYDRRAEQLEATIPDAKTAEKARRGQQVRQLRANAGDAYVAYSRILTLADDKGYGDALWKGIDLYDRSGDMQRMISALEVFSAERPDDAVAPDALLRLGRAYQAAGLFDKAIAAYQKNQFRHPQSLAASKSAVPLAQAYIAKGPENFAKAESVLLGVFENRALTPDAEEFKQALFELGQLYYRTGRYEEAVARLEEWTQRYPREPRLGQLLFLMADSYRKSATNLDVTLASADASADAGKGDAAEAATARRQRLEKARSLYAQVIEYYRSRPPSVEVDKLYNRLSHFYRADCLYDLGEYEEAIRLYDAAAFRYQDDPSALAAYVQIVNAYCALGKIDEARTANERAKWLLRKMPAEAFSDGSFAMPREYWEQWLKWTSASGMW